MNITHSCKRVAELLSQQLDEPLDLLDRLRLRVHLSMCSDCRNVDDQLKSMHALSADLFGDENDGIGDQDLAPDGPAKRP